MRETFHQPENRKQYKINHRFNFTGPSCAFASAFVAPFIFHANIIAAIVEISSNSKLRFPQDTMEFYEAFNGLRRFYTLEVLCD